MKANRGKEGARARDRGKKRDREERQSEEEGREKTRQEYRCQQPPRQRIVLVGPEMNVGEAHGMDGIKDRLFSCLLPLTVGGTAYMEQDFIGTKKRTGRNKSK